MRVRSIDAEVCSNAISEDLTYNHFTDCEGSCLVTTDRRDGPQSLHNRRTTNNRLPPRHVLSTNSERESDDNNKTFGDDGDGERDSDGDNIVKSTEESDHHDKRTCDDRGKDKPLTKTGKLLLKESRGNRFSFSVSESGRDTTHFCGDTRVHNNTLSTALSNESGHERHVETVSDRNQLAGSNRFGLLRDGFTLSGEKTFNHKELSDIDHTEIGGNEDTFFEDHDISRNEIGSGNFLLLSISDHLSHRDSETREST